MLKKARQAKFFREKSQQMTLITNLENSIDSLQVEVDKISPDICIQFPIPVYIHEVKNHIRLRTHSYFSRNRRKKFQQIQNQYGNPALCMYQKLMLAISMKDSIEHLAEMDLPKGILDELHSWYKRVIDDFGRQPGRYYSHVKEDFIYDLGVCCLKSIPVGGAWFVQVRRIGFRAFLTLDILRLIRIFNCFIFKTGGFKPFCVIHTVPRYILRFNCRQMNLVYRNIGELMKKDHKIKGIYRRSWFLDPALEAISPNLKYLREVPFQNGAMFFRTGLIREDVKNALAYSQHRQKLYQKGEYKPAAYAYIWPRKNLLSWLEQEGSNESSP